MRSPHSIRNWLILSALFAFVFVLTLSSRRNFELPEAVQKGDSLNEPVDSLANPQPLALHAELEKADTTAAERISFLRQTRLADFRREYAMKIRKTRLP